MVSRLQPQSGPVGGPEWAPSQPQGLEFLIEIPAADGTMLLRMFERGGRLAVECDESRLEEGARAFIHEMMRWSGLVGIRWKDEARKASE
jgi:hypothetical protein